MSDTSTLCYHPAYAMPIPAYHTPVSAATALPDRPFDLLLQSGTTASGDRVDIGIRDGRIAAVARMLRGATNATIALDGRVVLPGFVESHTHLDKALSAPPARNHSGTLYEAIEVMGEIFSTETTETIRARALRTAEMFLAAGTTTIRTHVDVHEHVGLAGLEALLSVREAMRGRLDLQIVALSAQLAGPGGTRSRELYEEAVRMGIDAVGGAPALDGDPRSQIDHVFAFALRHDLDIDLHMDESDDPRDFYLPYLAERTIAAGYQGRVVAGHCCALAAVDDTLAASHDRGRARGPYRGGHPPILQPLPAGTRRQGHRPARAYASARAAGGGSAGLLRLRQHPGPLQSLRAGRSAAGRQPVRPRRAPGQPG